MTHDNDASFAAWLPSSATRDPCGLRITVDRRGHTATLRLDGELDMATGESLREHIRRILRQDCPHRLLLDLTQLSFTDSVGINLMMWAHKQMNKRGYQLQLHNPQPQVRRVLEATGLDTQLHITSKFDPSAGEPSAGPGDTRSQGPAR